MDETATVALVAVAAVALFWFTKRQEASTAMLLAQLQQKKPTQSGPYALSVGQVVAVVGTAAATYAGGPSAGVAAANALAPR